MTEQEWRECDNSLLMLEFLRGRVSDRKARLFAVACCRRIGHLLNERERHAVELAERFCDGTASGKELVEARRGLGDLARALTFKRMTRAGIAVADQTTEFVARRAYRLVSEVIFRNKGTQALRQVARNLHISYEIACDARDAYLVIEEEEHAAQADLLRDIFGPLPFRDVPVPSTILTWNEGTVKRLADGIYEEKRFEDLPILADALIDAGCDNEEMLSHLRGPGPHVQGCWVLDLLRLRK